MNNTTNTLPVPVQSVGLPICTVNEFGRLIYWNEGAAALFDRSAADVLGCEWHTVMRTVEGHQCCPLCQTRWSLHHGELVYPVDVTLSINGSHQVTVMVPIPMSASGQTSVTFIILTREAITVREGASKPVSVRLRTRQLGDGRLINELTDREREILACVVNGWDARTIGTRLGISHATARTYVQRVLNKLGVRNKAQAVRLALTYNLVEVGCVPLPQVSPPSAHAIEP